MAALVNVALPDIWRALNSAGTWLTGLIYRKINNQVQNRQLYPPPQPTRIRSEGISSRGGL